MKNILHYSIMIAASFSILPQAFTTKCHGAQKLDFSFPFETYQQQVVIKFDSPQSAEKAELVIEPLYGGLTRAISCRWDDNNQTNLKAREIMEKEGIKGTWYLNSKTTFYHNGDNYTDTAANLLKGENSIGGHGYSHPYISYQNKNRIFQEIMQVRIEWESELNTLLNSYAFSFVNYRNNLEGDISQRDIFEALQRSGFYHLSVFKNCADMQPSDMIVSIIMPPENQSFEDFKAAVDWAMTNDELLENYRCISNSMHSWYGTEALQYDFDELEKRFDYLKSFPNVWYCNQNEYAAYRYQYLNTKMDINRKGSTLICTLTRQAVNYLNNAIPLTLSVKGIKADNISEVSSSGSKLLIENSSPENVLFNLPHKNSQTLPELIGYIENPDNRQVVSDSDKYEGLEDVKALLSFNGRTLKTQINNNSNSKIENLKITYRLPLAWNEGVKVENKSHILANQSKVFDFEPTIANDSSIYMGGSHYMTAQLDFTKDDKHCRLYTTCNYYIPFDKSFPNGKFVLMGPIKAENFDLDNFCSGITPDGLPPMQYGGKSWQDTNPEAVIPQDQFSPEVIRTQGDWFKSYSPNFALYSVIESKITQDVSILCDHNSVKVVYVNGKQVIDGKFKLNKGNNSLIIIQSHENFSGNGEHAGCFFRLMDAESNTRLTNIKYNKPKLPLTPCCNAAAALPAAPPTHNKPVKIALLQISAMGFDQQANLEKAEKFCRQAAKQQADIALLPEMFNIGYTAFMGTDEKTVKQWQQRAVPKNGPWVQHFAKLAKELNMAIGITYLQEWDPAPRNTITVFDRFGKEVLTYAKVHTCDFAAFEAATTPGEDWYVADLKTKNDTIKLGAMICFDREFPESARILMLKGAELVLTPNACLLADERLAQFGTRALENNMIMAMTNYPNPGYGGRSVVYMIDGKPLLEAGGEEGIYTTTVDMYWIRQARKRTIWGNAFRRPHRYNLLTSQEKEEEYERKNGFGEPFIAEER